MAVSVELLSDMDLVRETLVQPHVWEALSDDGFIRPDQFEPQPIRGNYYIGAWDGSEYLGLMIVYTLNAICGDVHVALLKSCGGIRAVQAGKLAIQWVWDNTHFRRLTSTNPTCNRLGARFARLVGMTQYGINPRSWLKDGNLYNSILFGVDKWAAGECSGR